LGVSVLDGAADSEGAGVGFGSFGSQLGGADASFVLASAEASLDLASPFWAYAACDKSQTHANTRAATSDENVRATSPIAWRSRSPSARA
jgi:hypothetical protein